MEFPGVDVYRLVGGEVARFDAAALQRRVELRKVIDEMGLASARAQGLRGAITSYSRMLNSDHQLYILADPDARSQCVGLLKTGTKSLFLYDRQGTQIECAPVCVLDFYVHESRQRKGYGKMLFNLMMSEEHMQPEHFAIDRPSDKLLGFLKKHFRLAAPINQRNNFVIFGDFFNKNPYIKASRSRFSSPAVGGRQSDGHVVPPARLPPLIPPLSPAFRRPQSGARDAPLPQQTPRSMVSPRDQFAERLDAAGVDEERRQLQLQEDMRRYTDNGDGDASFSQFLSETKAVLAAERGIAPPQPPKGFVRPPSASGPDIASRNAAWSGYDNRPDEKPPSPRLGGGYRRVPPTQTGNTDDLPLYRSSKPGQGRPPPHGRPASPKLTHQYGGAPGRSTQQGPGPSSLNGHARSAPQRKQDTMTNIFGVPSANNTRRAYRH